MKITIRHANNPLNFLYISKLLFIQSFIKSISAFFLLIFVNFNFIYWEKKLA